MLFAQEQHKGLSLSTQNGGFYHAWQSGNQAIRQSGNQAIRQSGNKIIVEWSIHKWTAAIFDL